MRVALVTGGMGGIGTAICKRFATAGMQVVANCLPAYPRKAEWLAGMAADGFRDVHAAEFDVTDVSACRAVIASIAKTVGPIDILVNGAGITRDATFRKMEMDDWHAVINSNLNSLYNVTKQVIDGMAERGWGRIVSLSSVNGTRGQFGQTNYSAAKAGAAGFSKALAQEVVRKGVTVNCVSPGYVDTDMVRAIRADVRQAIIAGIPMGRLAAAEEIAALVGFLASDEAGYITGANIPINGGMHMYG
ncbi:MAG: acetoacetyl-CoA reductase [Burkholderiales bacterium]